MLAYKKEGKMEKPILREINADFSKTDIILIMSENQTKLLEYIKFLELRNVVQK